jgi:hypothetical protein
VKTTIAILLLAGATLAADVVLTTDPSGITWVGSGGQFVAVMVPETTPTTQPPLTVTGTLNPDVTGVYTNIGTYNTFPAWQRADGWAIFAWTNTQGTADYPWWVICNPIGQTFPAWTKFYGSVPTGVYPGGDPVFTHVEGDATVTQ